MEQSKIKIDILPNFYLKDNGTFDKTKAINLCGKIAGVCYNREGFNSLKNEPIEKTDRRIDQTLNSGHHSVYDHTLISLNIQNIPKILAMVLNNEKQYATSEKSARYTPIQRGEKSIITDNEEILYNKWINIYKIKIKEKYGDIYNDSKIQKLAQENARYLVTVFMPTQMIYSTTIKQFNYIVSFMQKYIDEVSINNSFEVKLANNMKEFIEELDRLNILEDGLLKNEKERSLSLFGKDLQNKTDTFSDVYSVNYEGSFAQLAQAHRHRTLDYQMELKEEKQYFISPIIEDEPCIVNEWICDMNKVKDVNPQGELIRINERGTYENFILKCKERLCTAAQLEIMKQTRQTLLKYKKSLEDSNNSLAYDIEKYSHGARCTFPDYTCSSDCKFKEGKILTRNI